MLAHQIMVLDNGRVVEIGNHAQLVEQNGKYTGLLDAYLGKVI